MQRQVLLLLLVMNSLFLYSQTTTIKREAPLIPFGVEFTEAADYAKYQDLVYEIISYLETFPINEATDAYRKVASAFALKWLMGSPTVSPPFYANFVMPIMKENEKIGAIMMAASLFSEAKAIMDSNSKIEDKDLIEIGIKGMIRAYDLIDPKVKIRTLEKYIKLLKGNKLRKYIDGIVKE